MGAPSYIVADGRAIQHSGSLYAAGDALPFAPSQSLIDDGACVLADGSPEPVVHLSEPGEAVVGLDPKGVRVSKLRGMLEGIDSVAEILALRALDDRSSAAKHYARRLRDLGAA